MRQRQQKGPRAHYLIVVNKAAGGYSERSVRRLTGVIRQRNAFYTVVEQRTAAEALRNARDICRLDKRGRSLPPPITRRGKVTALVAAGGDGTVSQIASIAIEADLPMGILPMGRYNNIANSLCSDALEIQTAVNAIVNRSYRPIDVAHFGDRLVVGSVGFGLLPALAKRLEGQGPPRFAFRWSALASKVADTVKSEPMTVTIDAFRFDIAPRLFMINLLPYATGLQLSPASVADDHQAEIIFDVDCSPKDLGHYVRAVYKGKYVYGSDVRLFRGGSIKIDSFPKGDVLLDGDVITASGSDILMEVGRHQLKVFC